VPPRLVDEHPGGCFRRLLTVVEASPFGLIVVGEWQVLRNGSWVTVLVRRIRMVAKSLRRAEYQRSSSWDGSIVASPRPDSSWVTTELVTSG
jgi:hypothetical protein